MLWCLVIMVAPPAGEHPVTSQEFARRITSAPWITVDVGQFKAEPHRVRFTIRDPKELKAIADLLVFEGKVRPQGPKIAAALTVKVWLHEKAESGKAPATAYFSLAGHARGENRPGLCLFGKVGGKVYECTTRDDKAFRLLLDHPKVKAAIESASK